jgi:hypothetical protein
VEIGLDRLEATHPLVLVETGLLHARSPSRLAGPVKPRQ